MSSQEGLEILLEAALHIKNQGRHDVHFTCVGGGPGLVPLRQMAAEMGLLTWVAATTKFGQSPGQSHPDEGSQACL